MRILLAFLIGLFFFFYTGELITKIFKRPLPGISGFIITSLGILSLFYRVNYVDTGLQVLISLFVIGSGVGLLLHHLLSQGYIFSKKVEWGFIRRHDYFFERSLEIFPGALTWIALTSPIWLSFTMPFAVAYLILIADIYWLLNSLKIAYFIVIGFKKLTWVKKQPWLKKLEDDYPKEWKQYKHLVLLPTYKEPLEVLIPAFDAVFNSHYPKENIYLGVGFEAWAPKELTEKTMEYLKKNQHKIGGVFMTVHELLPGEIKGPGTNRNCMVRNAVKEFEKRGIKINDVLVTTLDADFVIHENFLAGALHKYLETPAAVRNKRSYTGSFLYYNNYWQTPTPMRLIATGTALWQLAEMTGSDKYQNFSSLTINMQSLLDIGLWIPDKVNDDSGFYWKAYFHFKGNYKVIPHYLPINADAVLDVNLVKTFQNQYLQLKRWAYGVEHIPFIFKQYFKSQDIDFWDKTDKLVFVLWANLRWGTLALFVTFAGLIIPYINPNYNQSTVAVNLPIISSYILTAAFFGLFSTVFVHERTVPKRPKEWSIIKKFWSYIQWILLPIILVTISTLPAIDAQTSLMMGRYLSFRVTNKARLSPS